jgi:hypothetical protein
MHLNTFNNAVNTFKIVISKLFHTASDDPLKNTGLAGAEVDRMFACCNLVRQFWLTWWV